MVVVEKVSRFPGQAGTLSQLHLVAVGPLLRVVVVEKVLRFPCQAGTLSVDFDLVPSPIRDHLVELDLCSP